MKARASTISFAAWAGIAGLILVLAANAAIAEVTTGLTTKTTVLPKTSRSALELYPLTQNPTVWLEKKVIASDGAENDNFGYALAISGKTALISSYVAAVNGNQAQGAVYVFTQSNGTWNQTQKLVASDGKAWDQFGESIAIHGKTALISANGVTINGNRFQGAVYVFTESNGVWTQVQKLTASDGAAYDNFGWSVAFSGNNALIGAPYAKVNKKPGQGAVYVFTNSNGSWTQTQKLTATDGEANDNFGRSVAVEGTTALIGATGATVNGNPGQGAAYVFTDSNGTWSESQKLTVSRGEPYENFGQAVALSNTTALIGAPLKRAVYAFTNSMILGSRPKN